MYCCAIMFRYTAVTSCWIFLFFVGMPIMPNMGAGMMPGGPTGQFPNMAEVAGHMGGGTCIVM